MRIEKKHIRSHKCPSWMAIHLDDVHIKTKPACTVGEEIHIIAGWNCHCYLQRKVIFFVVISQNFERQRYLNFSGFFFKLPPKSHSCLEFPGQIS